jgi:hypothetical protein
MKFTTQFIATLAIAMFSFTTITPVKARAEDTTTTMQNKAEDVKADSKKGMRKMKRKGRKAMGTDTAGKDMKDAANDMGDDMHAAGQKIKHKANK